MCEKVTDKQSNLKMRLCSGCKDLPDSPRYCSTDCQRAHWKTRKKTCARLDKQVTGAQKRRKKKKRDRHKRKKQQEQPEPDSERFGNLSNQRPAEPAAEDEEDDGIPDFEGDFDVGDNTTFDPARVDGWGLAVKWPAPEP